MTNRVRVTSDPDQYTKEELIISEDVLKVAAPANAQAKLKLGDLSLHHNCYRMAEESYQYVFDVFVGEEYKEFREEARQGLVDVYTKIQQKI
jgi:hypothetical protein